VGLIPGPGNSTCQGHSQKIKIKSKKSEGGWGEKEKEKENFAKCTSLKNILWKKIYIFFVFFVFSGQHPQHMEVPRLGAELEL